MSSALHYLKEAGFEYKPSESPDLWTHLESQITESNSVGGRFSRIPDSSMVLMIEQGEAVLLEAFAEHHRLTGKLTRVDTVIDMPYIVGTEGIIPLEGIDPDRCLRLIDKPGTSQERIVYILAADSDAIPCTQQVTVSGGLYSDQRTLGYYGLRPGNGAAEKRLGGKCGYLATPDDIRHMAQDMAVKADDIASVTREECDEMLARATKLMG